MTTQKLNDFIHISPGFKAAVNLRKERDNLAKVAGFVPTEVAREILLDFARKLHPTTHDLRSRIVMGTYGTGKSHLALVLLNFFLRPVETPELKTVIEKLDLDIKNVLLEHRQQIPDKYLVVNLYGAEGNIADGLMMGLRRALEEAGLEHLLPHSAFDAALDRIKDVEENYTESFEILKKQTEENGHTVGELKTRLAEYQKNAFDLFCDIYPSFTSGASFSYATMLDPATFYESIVKELRKKHGYGGIAIFWDEFGHKMEEVVKDPTGREGLILQDFAECCNASEENQLHLYLFCHRSLKEYHDISKTAHVSTHKQLEDDLRKIEGRFKQYILKSTDVETFQLIDAIIIPDEQSSEWAELTAVYDKYLDELVQETARFRFFSGFTRDELKATVVLGTYPLHPMAVYSLPAISEKVAQNNRTLFTCLCEDEPGGFKRFLDKAIYDTNDFGPPMFTVDSLWDYFANDVKQQDRTYSIFRDFEHLKPKLGDNDSLGLRILKAVSVFRVTNPSRFKATEEILAYSLDIPGEERALFSQELARHSDLKNENHILMQLQADGSFRPAVNSATESIIEKVRKLIVDTPEKLNQKPVQYLKSLWKNLSVNESFEATDYGDEYGVYRQLAIEPISMFQLRERIHILTKNLGDGTYQDGLILAVLCATSGEIDEAKGIASSILSDIKYKQVVLSVPKQPVELTELLLEHQALTYLKNNEASLYGEGGELYEEWQVWDDDKSRKIADIVGDLFSPEKQMLDYYWKGILHEVQNNRQLKKLATTVMREVFPHCPYIGEKKLTIDDFGGNWGYRKDCRDIVMKLANKDAADSLWRETAAAPKHIINLILKSNGILGKNQTGETVLGIPDENVHLGASKVFNCIAGYLKKARQGPVEMKNLVRNLRKPLFGLKCRAMPLFFAAAAHKELSLGNISFEFQRRANYVEKITSIENDTLEKVFTTPEKYKLVYVNVSSNQNSLVAGLANIYDVSFSNADPPLERVKKVGTAIGTWWRTLPKHAQMTAKLSDSADVLRKHIFKPLAELEPDTQRILLKDAFDYVFDTDKKVKNKDVEGAIEPIKTEFEGLFMKLKSRVFGEYASVFDSQAEENTGQVLASWFNSLDPDKRNYAYNGEPAILVDICRKSEELEDETLLLLAEKLTGLSVGTWADEMVLKFGAKLDSAKNFVETFTPPSLPDLGLKKPDVSIENLEPNQGSMALSIKGKNKTRNFEIIDNLSPNGQALENMLNTTVDQIGRSLDEKEKITIIYRFISKHVFGFDS